LKRRSHDYARHGTTGLFTALNVQEETVLSQFHRRHRAVEFKKFLVAINTTIPREAVRACHL
ncbi:MAG TPA: IS630 family transposase, partial [Corynebacterium sp.]|nr:IS630 family transposase [Corynebacterium sp.]